jgi:hypothetical protein
MKKIILGGVAAIAIAAFAVVNVNINSQNENLLSDLALANVEALADNEGGSVSIPCTIYNSTCSFSATLGDGSSGTMVLSGMRN